MSDRRPKAHTSSAPADGLPPEGAITAAFQAWRAWPLSFHLLAVLTLACVATIRWWEPVTFAGPQIDERIYLEAARHVLQGGSPYDQPVFFYPPVFAFALARLLEILGEPGVLALLRTLNLLGLGMVVWISMAWVPLGRAWRLLLGMAAIGLVTGVQLGLDVGNLSFLIGATILAPLLLWRRHPILSGLALGVGAAVKPLAVVVILLLFAHRPERPGRNGLWAGGLAAAVAAGLLLSFPDLADFLQLGRRDALAFHAYPFDRTISLHRWLSSWGLPVGATGGAALVAAAAAVFSRLRPWSRLELLCLSLAAMTLAAPALWTHSLVLTLPVQATALSLALSRNAERQRKRNAGQRPETRPPLGGHTELILVLLGVLAIHLCDQIGGTASLPGPLKALLLTPPTFAPAALAAYVIWRVSRPGDETKGPSASSSQPLTPEASAEAMPKPLA